MELKAINFDTFFSEVFVKARKAGLKIAIHAAEVKSDEEMDEILDFAPDRLGHALILNEKHRATILGKVVLICLYFLQTKHSVAKFVNNALMPTK
jgi:hypothetical protein